MLFHSKKSYTTLNICSVSNSVIKCFILHYSDIAARNVLLTSREADKVAKIADFGLARDVKE